MRKIIRFDVLKKLPMKRIVVLFIFVCFAKINVAQLYQPFPTDSSMWREWAYDVDASYNDTWDYQYFIEGDTIIAGNNYHKILYTGTYHHVSWTSYSINYVNQYKGAFREDTAKHILFFPYGDTTEYVLYDFNLSIGDTLTQSYLNSFGSGNWVSAIDSILVGGQYHKRYHISNDTAAASWNLNYVSFIEGVGSTFGLLGLGGGSLWPVFERESHLSCYTHNGITEYTDSTTTSCNPIIIGVTEQSDETPISIFPNPTTGIINLKTPTFEKTQIEIFDVLGKTIYQKEISTPETEINLSSLPKGVYFLKAISGNKRSTTQKIILQ